MKKFTLLQVSIFYLLLIAVLAFIGFRYSVKLGSKVGIMIGDAAGSAAGAILGVFISYQLFTYVRKNNMLQN